MNPQEEIAVINATLQGLRQEIQAKLESHANLGKAAIAGTAALIVLREDY